MVFSRALEVTIGLTCVFLTRSANLLQGVEELPGDPRVAGSEAAAFRRQRNTHC